MAGGWELTGVQIRGKMEKEKFWLRPISKQCCCFSDVNCAFCVSLIWEWVCGKSFLIPYRSKFSFVKLTHYPAWSLKSDAKARIESSLKYVDLFLKCRCQSILLADKLIFLQNSATATSVGFFLDWHTYNCNTGNSELFFNYSKNDNNKNCTFNYT